MVISCSKLRSNRRSQKSVDCEVEPDIVFQLIFGRLKSPRRTKFSLGLCVLRRDLSREKCDLSAVGGIYRRVTWKDFLWISIEIDNILASLHERIRLEGMWFLTANSTPLPLPLRPFL